jgi:hypothetical protein
MLLLRIGIRYPLDEAWIDWVVSLIEFSNHGTPWKVRLPSTVYHTWTPPVFAMKRWCWRNGGWTIYAVQRSCNAWLQASITLWNSRNHLSSNEAKTFTYKSINESWPHRDLRRLIFYEVLLCERRASLWSSFLCRWDHHSMETQEEQEGGRKMKEGDDLNPNSTVSVFYLHR